MRAYVKAGTQFCVFIDNEHSEWGETDRAVRVQYSAGLADDGTILVAAKLEQHMAGPTGPLDPGSIIWVHPSDLMTEDDTETDLKLVADEPTMRDLSRIIARLQEELYDVQHNPGYWYSARLKDRERSLKKRIVNAKAELAEMEKKCC